MAALSGEPPYSTILGLDETNGRILRHLHADIVQRSEKHFAPQGPIRKLLYSNRLIPYPLAQYVARGNKNHEKVMR